MIRKLWSDIFQLHFTQNFEITFEGQESSLDCRLSRICIWCSNFYEWHKVADLLNADGVLCVLSAAMAHQVGAVDSVDKLRLCLQPLHRACKPTAQEPNRSSCKKD